MRQDTLITGNTEKPRERRLRLLRVCVMGMVVTGGACLAWLSLPGERARPSPVQSISVLDQPLPDSPPPEPAPEPEENYETVPEVEQFVEMTPPPADAGNTSDDSLGLDTEGAAGSDGFGLRARRGGRGLIGTDSGSGTDAAAAWRGFAAGVAQRLERLLNATGEIRKADYDLRLRLWLAADGHVARVEIARSSGFSNIDAAVLALLERGVDSFGEPPRDMPQPVNIRVRSSDAG